MRYTNIEKLIVKILSAIAIISFLVLAITNFLVGVPFDIKPIYFAIGYAKLIISFQIIFLHILFLTLIVIVFYNIKWIVICILKKKKKQIIYYHYSFSLSTSYSIILIIILRQFL
ncbi:MAG TPA: hypothetical protein QF753_09835 [Victivallales bacterium]|nr:hypothetical protein [Victivallales bacterium]